MVMGMIKDVVMKSHLLILNEGFFMSLILVASPSSNTLMRNSLILFIVVGLGFWSKSREGVCDIFAFLQGIQKKIKEDVLSMFLCIECTSFKYDFLLDSKLQIFNNVIHLTEQHWCKFCKINSPVFPDMSIFRFVIFVWMFLGIQKITELFIRFV